jgi:hypothetical protein
MSKTKERTDRALFPLPSHEDAVGIWPDAPETDDYTGDDFETDCPICEHLGHSRYTPGHYGSADCINGASLASGGSFRHCACRECLP